MRVSGAQIEAFSRADMLRFEDELRREMGDDPRPVEADAVQAKGWVRRGIARARKYGVLTELNIRWFFEFEREFGEEFEHLVWVAPILSDVALSGEEKMGRIEAMSLLGER